MLTDNKKGTFELHLDEEVVVKMTFIFARTTKLIINHIEVKTQDNDKGYGKLLIQKAMEFAKEKDLNIVPLCSFVKAYFDKHPESSNALAS